MKRTEQDGLFRDGQSHKIWETKMILDNYYRKMKICNELKQSRPVEARIAKHDAEDMLFQKSMHTLLPLLHSFHFVGSTPVLDIYNI